MNRRTYCLAGINPEPWAIGPLGYRKLAGKIQPFVGPNLKLQSFQNEVKDELERIINHEPPSTAMCTLRFFFWRRLETWDTPTGRKSGAHQADVTNLQKGLEDALQGIIITNDRNVQSITSEIVEQGPDVLPGILIVHNDLVISEYAQHVSPDILWQFDIDRKSSNKVDLGNEW